MRDLGGKFRILAELGQGGSSRVWLAALRGPSGFSKLVVLKSMKDELKSEPDLAQMFLNEARLAAQLSHPNIVQTNEVFEHDGLPVIVMEYLDGQSLAAILARKASSDGLSRNLELRILSEALAGLHAAHELRDYSGLPLEVVHRDVSPHNVLVTYDGQTKVLDFGIAKLTGLAETTESGVIRGKLHYMAPEQITAGRIDRRADIYAAGVIMWEMLTGVRMWRGVNEAVVMNRVLGGKLPDLMAIAPATPPRLAQMVARATALSADDRYANASEFQAAIDGYLQASGQEPRARDVGDAVARLFSDRKLERQLVVERELSRVTEQSELEYAGHRPLALTALEIRAESASRIQQRSRLTRLKGWAPWLLALLLGTALLLTLARMEGPRSTPSFAAPRTELPSSALPKAPSHAPAPPPASVQMTIRATPSNAQILFDGVAAEQNPFETSIPRDPTSIHTLEVSAPGHTTETRRLSLERDGDLVVNLRPLAPSATQSTSPRVSPKPPQVPSRVRATKASTAAPTDCDPPYFFDARGVKKFKARCL